MSSVRHKLVELAYVRWELRERAASEAKRPTVVRPVRRPRLTVGWPRRPAARERPAAVRG